MKNIASYAIAVLAILIIAFMFISFSSKRPAAELLMSYGWEISESPIESVNVVIPKEFDDVYKNYNELQKEIGFDLEKYKGKSAVRYTYIVENYPQKEYNVRANVLVVDGKAVGGDICTVEFDGFMHSLKMPGYLTK